ncbi:syntaxin 7 [Sporothrix brasiliensis 5110]|uniref:Syntaxin 7 n=1 Tax=Sporothrix brasiliensis 5110 TaxID=1398154 RepID=A0A0C2IJ97_9PEZI|nr:syntaxin 7 [Sporothrix brasiliensis 5110]KIH89221.1 syntaxin 7 [Sporothrix brasiliensis 5110]
MSFDQLSSMEAGRRRGGGGSGGQYSDDPDFQKLAQQLSNKLFKLQGNIANLSRDIGHLGTRQDNARVRERVNDVLEESREMFKEVGEGVKKVQGWDDVTPTQRYQQQKLSREFQGALSEFQTLQRQALEKEKASVSAARAAADEGGDASGGTTGAGGQPLQQQQLEQQQELARLAPQDEVDFQEALIIEREDEIRNIEQGVGDLNVLFTQVATMVHEQGEQLDNIADNVENVRSDTRGADYELRSAARYQRNARSKACCLLLVLSVILTIVLLAVFLG